MAAEGCIEVGCGKLRGVGVRCPHHQLLRDAEKAEKTRKEADAKKAKTAEQSGENELATSPLRAFNPDFEERKW